MWGRSKRDRPGDELWIVAVEVSRYREYQIKLFGDVPLSSTIIRKKSSLCISRLRSLLIFCGVADI